MHMPKQFINRIVGCSTISKAKPMALSKPLFVLALFLTLANNVHSQEESTTFSFDTFSANSADLTYQGGTHVPPGTNLLRLTQTSSAGLPLSWKVGRVLYSKPVQFRQSSPARQATFESTITFSITPNASGGGAADGLAFFMAPVGTAIPSGSGGGYLGLFPGGAATSVFAVEFDNFRNRGWDPDYRHIGIDADSVRSRSATRFDSGTGEAVTARISYNGSTRRITVVATSGPATGVLIYVLDLAIVLPEVVQVGISSSTGKAPGLGIHDIHSWNFTSTFVGAGGAVGETNQLRQAI